MQLVHGYPSHPQFAQQPVPLVILVADVKPDQPDDHTQRTMSQTGERIDNLFQLVAEQDSHKYETPSVKEGTQSIEEEESGSAYASAAGQRRRQGAQARDEFRCNDAFHPVPREEALRSPNTRVRLQRDAAEKTEHALAAMASQIKPDQIGHHRTKCSGTERDKPIHFAGDAQSACRQQPWRGGKRNTHLLHEHRRKQNRSAMPDKKLQCFIHKPSSPILSLISWRTISRQSDRCRMTSM